MVEWRCLRGELLWVENELRAEGTILVELNKMGSGGGDDKVRIRAGEGVAFAGGESIG